MNEKLALFLNACELERISYSVYTNEINFAHIMKRLRLSKEGSLIPKSSETLTNDTKKIVERWNKCRGLDYTEFFECLELAVRCRRLDIVRMLDYACDGHYRRSFLVTAESVAIKVKNYDVLRYLAFKDERLRLHHHNTCSDFYALVADDAVPTMRFIIALRGEPMTIRSPACRCDIVSVAWWRNQRKAVKLFLDLGLLNAEDRIMMTEGTAEAKQMANEHLNLSAEQLTLIRATTLNEIQKELEVQLMQFVHPEILDICIAMSALLLPAYVLLWIVDYLPNFSKASHFRKIRLIENIVGSIRKIKR